MNATTSGFLSTRPISMITVIIIMAVARGTDPYPWEARDTDPYP